MNQILVGSAQWLKGYFIALMIAKGISIILAGVMYRFRGRMLFGIKVIRYLQFLTIIMAMVIIMHLMTLDVLFKIPTG